MTPVIDAVGNLFKRFDWGGNFWRFALTYFVVPWLGLIASLSMRRDGSPWPLWYRLSHFIANYIFFAFQVLMTWLWIRAIVAMDWAVVVILPFAALMNLLVLVMRLQTVYRFSSQAAAARGDWHDSH